MTKPRATTIQQRFGFQDADLKTPLHDEILLWLDDNLVTIVSRIIKYSPEWTAKELSKADRYMKGLQEHYDGIKTVVSRTPTRSTSAPAPSNKTRSEHSLKSPYAQDDPIREWVCPPPPPKPPHVQIKSIWEQVVSTGKDNKYVVGFIDLTAVVDFPQLNLEYECHYRSVGEPDYSQYAKTKWETYKSEITLHFEIKTTIGSLGELVRQIRMYQTYTDGQFFVVCPDERLKKPLASQGIGFVKYPMPNQQEDLL